MIESSNNPVVSIIIPCYNQGLFLIEAIQSIEVSAIQDYEIIIVNDGSTDEQTLNVFNDLEQKGYSIIHQKNSGVCSARNTGIAQSKSEYILPLDADNKVHPEYWRKAINIMQSNPEVGVVYADAILFGEKNENRSTGEFDIIRLLTGNYIDACAVFRKKVWLDCKGYDSELNFTSYEDWELWVHAIEKGWKFYYLNEPLFYYRVQQQSRNSKLLNPEVRKQVVSYIFNKHASLYLNYIAEIGGSLHAVIAHWESTFQEQINQQKNEFEKKLKVHQANLDAALKEEFKKLDEHYHAERKKVEEHFLNAKNEIVSGYEKHIENLKEGFESQKKLLENHYHEEAQKLHELAHQREIELHDKFSRELGKLEERLSQIHKELEMQKTYASHLSGLITQYEDRIASMESTRTWRLRKQYLKFKSIFKSTGKKKRRIPGLGFIKKVVFFTVRKGKIMTRRLFKKIFKHLYLWLEEFPVRIIPVSELNGAVHPVSGDIYHQWMLKNFPREVEFRQFKKESEQFEYKPLVSILLPVYNPPVEFFKQTLNSVIGQIYENWELCIADDASTDKRIREVIEEYRKKDFRIKVVYRKENGHISRSSNSALELVSGEFTLLLDHDDLLTQDCIYHVVKLLNNKKDVDLIYSDEDKIDENGNHTMPHFKPKWCPDNFLSRNYLGHVVVCRSSILKEIEGFRVGFEGSQDYDMLLRFTEKTQKIEHIPRVLYHWRIHAASAAQSEEAKPYAYHAAQKALTESLIRRDEEAEVGFLAGFRGYSIRYKLQYPGKVSIIIPTKDNTDVLKVCVDSIFEKSSWRNFEVIVISNNSTDKKLFHLLEAYHKKHPDQFRYYEHNIPFNFSKLMNFGNSHATGDYLLLLNNDTEVVTPDWMEAMMEQAQRKSTGAVGVKLLYHNDTIQHAGVIIGLGGIAGHTFVGIHKDAAGYFNFIQSINNYSAVTAACLMVSKKKYEEVKGFDETFEVEYNDVDFCLRLMDAGYHNVYLPHVELYHYESLTRGHPHMSKESYDRHVKELTLFKDRWQQYIDDDPCYSPNLGRGVHDFGIAL